jgi:two-component system LytT family response regulator
MITAVIIDDDINLRNGIKGLLNLYAPEIAIIGEAENVKNGIT